MSQIQVIAWIESLRPKTLPLAFAAIMTGSCLAFWKGYFQWDIALLALLTAGLLQILSNLANDYGDAIKGSDTESRLGPNRGMQKGLISLHQMKRALILVIVLAIFSGLGLIVIACKGPGDIIGFVILGLASIIAAITYTIGRKPYGYFGFGDISVLIFFGWLSVVGSYYLQSTSFDYIILIPATACGLLSVAVLNVNNLRDIDSDRENGKNTLVVRFGAIKARRYHICLLLGAVIFFSIFAAYSLHSIWGWLFILAVPLLYRHGKYVVQHQEAIKMQPMLEQIVKIALLMNLLFSVGVILS